MKILLLGVGMQGKAALYDLANSPAVSEVLAADLDIEPLQALVDHKGLSDKVSSQQVDAADEESLDRAFRFQPQVVIDLLPPAFIPNVVDACMRHKVSLVNTYYATPDVLSAAQRAADRGISILPECGLDPGLDLLLLGRALSHLERVESVRMYGAGVPEPGAAENSISYKVSWTLDGVLASYYRPARLLVNGETIDIEAGEIFSPENIHPLHIDGLGGFEAFPNEDAIAYMDRFDFDRTALRDAGRYTLRWPGHCAFWKTMVELHLLDSAPVIVGGAPVDRKAYLAAAIAPHIQYAAHERDLAIVRIEVRGKKGGVPRRVTYQIVDRRDLDTGFTGMSRTVGFSASIGAQYIASGKVSKPGVLSIARDFPFDDFSAELLKRGIHIQSGVTE